MLSPFSRWWVYILTLQRNEKHHEERVPDPTEEGDKKTLGYWVADCFWDTEKRSDPSKQCSAFIIRVTISLGKNWQLHCRYTQATFPTGSLFLKIPCLEMHFLGSKFCRLLNAIVLRKKSLHAHLYSCTNEFIRFWWEQRGKMIKMKEKKGVIRAEKERQGDSRQNPCVS